MRYVVALLVAFLILGGGSIFVWYTWRSVERECRQIFKDQKEARKLPPELQGVDLDTIGLDDFGFPLSPAQQGKLALAAFITNFRYVLAVLVLAVCLGIAAVWPRRT
jgi:hypothetical protein